MSPEYERKLVRGNGLIMLSSFVGAITLGVVSERFGTMIPLALFACALGLFHAVERLLRQRLQAQLEIKESIEALNDVRRQMVRDGLAPLRPVDEPPSGDPGAA